MIELAKLAAGLLWSWVGVVGLAAVGVLVALVGVVGVLFVPTEKAPTAVSVGDLGGGGKPPAEWVRVTGGAVFLPEALTHTNTRTGRRSGTETKTEMADYVPLLAAADRAEWLGRLAKDGAGAKYDYKTCKVMLVVRPGADPSYPKGRFNPAAPETIAPDYEPTGVVVPADRLDSYARGQFADAFPGLDPAQVVFVKVGEEPVSKGAMGVVAVFGLGLLAPLVAKLVFGRRAARAAKGRAVDDLADAAGRGVREGVGRR